jgi:glycosyltransferase involved in cell wall biosynthesis
VEAPVVTRRRILIVGAGQRFISGVSYYTYFLVRRLAVDHDVSVVLMRSIIPRFLYPGRARVGAPISQLRTSDLVPTFDGIDWTLFPSLWRARRFIAAQHPDVVVLQWWSVANLLPYLSIAGLARRRSIRIILEMHEGTETAEARLPLIRSISRRGLTRLVRRVDWCVVHSTFDRDAFSAAFGVPLTQVRVIALGPFDVVNAPPTATQLRDEITILFFGTIRPYKGLEDLIDAYDALPRDTQQYRLLVVGETWEGWTLPLEKIATSPNRHEIEVINRYVTDAEVPDLFARADLVALPYLRSSASGPLHLAMARGLPVVVTDVGGLTQAVEGYGGAIMVEPSNPMSLRDGIVRAIELVGAVYDDPHSWDQTATEFEEIFEHFDTLSARVRTP